MKLLKRSKNKRLHHNHNRIWGLSMSIILMIIIVLSVVLFTPVFSIKELRIVGINYSDNAFVYEKIKNGFIDENLLLLDRNEMDKIIRSNIPEYKLSDVRKLPPSVLEIDLNKRTEKYLVKTGSEIIILDSEYLPIDSSSEQSKYNVVYDKELTLGEKITDETLLAGIQYSEMGSVVYIVDDQISINLEGGGQVLLPKEDAVERSEELSNLLQKILQKYTIENRNINVIDLRYSKPLIKFD